MQSSVVFTLIFVKSMNKVLLGFKKRGFGEGKWNGYGGKVDPNDKNIIQCAIRELKEESTLIVKTTDLVYLGHVTYENVEATEKRIVHIFRTNKVDGTPSETDEMKPRWFDFVEIPYENMWADMEHWLPLVLNGLFLKANFVYDNNEAIVNMKVDPLDSPPQLPRDDL